MSEFAENIDLHVIIIAAAAQMRARLRQMLAHNTYQYQYIFHEAATGTAGLSLCRSLCRDVAAGPAVVLLDVDLPGADGGQILQALSEMPQQLPVIALTGPAFDTQPPELTAVTQDFIARTDLNPLLLTRAVHNSLLRFRLLGKLQESEQRFRAIVESATDFALMTLDDQGCFAGWNQGAERIFGYTEAETLGQPVALIFTEDDRAERRPEQELTLALTHGYATDTRWYRHKDGRRLWASGSMTPLRSNRESIRGFLKIVQDRTDAKQAEEALKQVQVLTEAANRSKSEFLTNMSHEIRSPMTAILGYADLLTARLSDPDDQAYLTIIRDNGRFLLSIVNDILDLAKIEAGKLTTNIIICSLGELIAGVRSLMEVRSQEGHLDLSVEYAGLVPATINTDPMRLRQILINLIGNAIKFTETGSVRLVVSFHAEPIPVLQFDVIDTGIGMSELQLEHLFQPFCQGDTSTVRRFGGSGLGLVISLRLAQMLGGGITVKSQPARGSTFTLKVAPGDLAGVPLIEPNQNVVIKPDSASPLPALAGRILVVDDRRDIRELVRYYIENAGGRVETAENGQTALDQLEVEGGAGSDPFDLIIIDMQMPVLDGFQTVAMLRARGFAKPIIALTAGAMLGEREKCLEIGCDDYLSKPIEGRYLVEMISRHLARVTPAHPFPVPNTTAAPDAVPVNRRQRVLLVEDNANARDATARLLALAGHDVDIAADGRSAIANARNRAPEVVLLDIGLPDMDGYAVLRELKALPDTRNTIFIALSGSDEDENEQAGSAGSFDHHVLKPASLNGLLALIRSHQA